MNVLITSASSKVLLVRAFQAAVHPLGGKVIAADIAPDCPALVAADDAFILPRSDDPSFGETLARLCRREGIGLVVPTRDGELHSLAALVPTLAGSGTKVLVASAATLDLCGDKRKFNRFCLDHGFAIARLHATDHIPPFPVFIRPATGAGGAGARPIDDLATWQALGDAREGLIVQDVVDAPEYTIDALLDFNGRPLQAVARRRLAVRNGEAYKSRVDTVDDLATMALDLCAKLGCVGHNVVQAFYRPENGPRFIEVNPRFGGASNLSIVAGLESPARIIQLLAGKDQEARRPRPIRYGLTMLRYSDDIFIEAEDLRRIGKAT